MQIEQLTLLITLNEPRLNEFVSIINCKVVPALVSLWYFSSILVSGYEIQGLSHSLIQKAWGTDYTHTHTPETKCWPPCGVSARKDD